MTGYTQEQVRQQREDGWDCGWNAALMCAVMLLQSKLLRADVRREEIAEQLWSMRIATDSTMNITPPVKG